MMRHTARSDADCHRLPVALIVVAVSLGLLDAGDLERAARWIRSQQRGDGSWANFEGGPGDLSTTVEAYTALRLAGDATDAPSTSKVLNQTVNAIPSATTLASGARRPSGNTYYSMNASRFHSRRSSQSQRPGGRAAPTLTMP